MPDATCQLEHSIDVDVSPDFAWSWRTEIKNWDDPPAQFQLEGPFGAGSWGSTIVPGQAPLRWQIRDVRPGEAFTIAMPLDDALISFEWMFEAVSSHRTRITQRIWLSGNNAPAYVDQVQAGFGATLADGMKRIADAMQSHYRGIESRSLRGMRLRPAADDHSGLNTEFQRGPQ